MMYRVAFSMMALNVNKSLIYFEKDDNCKFYMQYYFYVNNLHAWRSCKWLRACVVDLTQSESVRGEITRSIGALHDMTYGSFCYQREHRNALRIQATELPHTTHFTFFYSTDSLFTICETQISNFSGHWQKQLPLGLSTTHDEAVPIPNVTQNAMKWYAERDFSSWTFLGTK